MNDQQQFDLSVLYAEDEAITREEILLFLKRRVRDVFAAAGREGRAGTVSPKKTRPRYYRYPDAAHGRIENGKGNTGGRP